MVSARATNINLLSQDEFSSTTLGRFLLWALSIGRYIVVFTELIVILSFLSRFKLDRDLTDLNENINRQKAIIMAYGDLEDRFRFLQQQLALVRSVREGVLPTDILNLFSKVQPSDIKLTGLTVNNSSVELSGVALSPGSFTTYLKRLSADPRLSDIDLKAVSSDDGGLTINFSVSIGINQT